MQTAGTLSSLLSICKGSLKLRHLHTNEQIDINQDCGEIINHPASPEIGVVHDEAHGEESGGQSIKKHKTLRPEFLAKVEKIKKQVIRKNDQKKKHEHFVDECLQFRDRFRGKILDVRLVHRSCRKDHLVGEIFGFPVEL